MIRSKLFAMASLAMVFVSTSAAWGHFPWLVRNADGSVQYFFGEGLTDRTYKLPPSIAAAKVYAVVGEGETKQLELQAVETEDFVGLQGKAGDLPANAPLISEATFGIYHGARLNYYTLHLGGQLPTSREAYKSRPSKLDLSAELVDTENGVDVYVSWKGKPLADVEVHLYCDEGHEEGNATTDADGKVSFTNAEVEEGINGIMLGHTVEEAGKLKDVAYESASHYLTVTFVESGDKVTKPSDKQTSQLAPLPFAITSFGAVRHGDAFYVYGGHTGTAHSYSTEAQSNKLLKLDLSQEKAQWEELAEGPRLQGLGMVAHQDRLILVGGFTAMNEEGEEHDLRSQTSVLAYDVKDGKWTKLPALPEARSSHDAALVGDRLYVVGGWQMDGDDTTWHSTAWSMDLSAAEPAWTEIAKPPFVRRALATVAHGDKLFVLGGMNERGGPTKAVAIYDPATNAWSEGDALIGEQSMAGFGAAGWSVDGRLIVSTYEGDIQRWNDESQKWELLGKSAEARFFHRLLPLDSQHLISLGGANMEEGGKFLDLEVISSK